MIPLNTNSIKFLNSVKTFFSERTVLWKEKNVDQKRDREELIRIEDALTIPTTMVLNVGVGRTGEQEKIEGF